MYALGIPNRQYRRTTQVLGHEGAEPIPYQSERQDDGFYLFTFPNCDEYDFRDIVRLLKVNGITTIGADTQLTEKKIMKLTDLISEQPSPDENDLIDVLKNALNRMEDKQNYRGGGFEACELSNHYLEDIRDIIEDYEEESTMKSITMDAPSALNERFQKLAGIKPLYEQGFDDRLKSAMGMSDDEFEDEITSRDPESPFPGPDSSSKGYQEARKLIAKLREKTYRKFSDLELEEFSKEMVEHLLDNIAAEARARVILAKKA